MAKKDRSRVALKTQSDGRRFAVDVLHRLALADPDKATAYPYNADGYDHGEKVAPYRRGPQWDGFYKDLSHLIREASDEAVKGFAAILTDALAGSITMELDAYDELEAAGLLLDFGLPAKAWPKPQPRTPEASKSQKRAFQARLDAGRYERASAECEKELASMPSSHDEYRQKSLLLFEVDENGFDRFFGPSEYHGYSYAPEVLEALHLKMQEAREILETGRTLFSQERHDARVLEVRSRTAKADTKLQEFIGSVTRGDAA